MNVYFGMIVCTNAMMFVGMKVRFCTMKIHDSMMKCPQTIIIYKYSFIGDWSSRLPLLFTWVPLYIGESRICHVFYSVEVAAPLASRRQSWLVFWYASLNNAFSTNRASVAVAAPLASRRQSWPVFAFSTKRASVEVAALELLSSSLELLSSPLELLSSCVFFLSSLARSSRSSRSR